MLSIASSVAVVIKQMKPYLGEEVKFGFSIFVPKTWQ